MLDLSTINKDWTLFLDRDGVINHDLSPYTLNAGQFEFYDGVVESIKKFSRIFKYILVATNQRGVGRKLMTEDDLLGIHDKMKNGIIEGGGRLEKIYYCTSVDNNHPERKPNPGMALRAMKDYPDIIPAQSIMVGNNISDMEFGRSAGMHTILLSTTGVKVKLPDPLVDFQFRTLAEFASALPETSG